MSDGERPPGPGWWKASDGRWYPPEQHPDHRRSRLPPPGPPPPAVPAPSPPPAPPAPASGRGGVARGCAISVAVVVGLLLVLGIIGAVVGTRDTGMASECVEVPLAPELGDACREDVGALDDITDCADLTQRLVAALTQAGTARAAEDEANGRTYVFAAKRRIEQQLCRADLVCAELRNGLQAATPGGAFDEILREIDRRDC